MQVKHVCQDGGALLAVHFHDNWQQVKDCRKGMRRLCDDCRPFPGCPLPQRTRVQESQQ